MYCLKSKRACIIFLNILVVMFCFNASAAAKDISVELQLDREFIEVGDIITLGLVINNVQNVPAPQLPSIDGFKSQYLGPATKMSIVNGLSTSSITHRYRLVAMKTGEFALGPFSFTHQGDTYTSQTKQIKVVDRGQGAQQGAYMPGYGNDNRQQDLNGKIFLTLSADKEKAYINERIALTIKLYVNNLTVRDIKYPAFEGQGFIKEEFGSPNQYRENVAGEAYDIVEFNTWLYPTKAGQVRIGPAAIQCNVVSRSRSQKGRSGFDSFFDDAFFSDFFSRLQVYPQEVNSEELLVEAMEFPEQNKPEQFFGAVGDFKMQVKAAPLKLKVGDPITLNMEISGQGNFDSVQSPVFDAKEQFKVYASQANKEQGTKRFEQVIIPLSKNINKTPEIVFVYFNPRIKEYITLKQEPFAIEVAEGDDQGLRIVEGSPVQGAAPTHVLGTDIVYIKEEIGKLGLKGKNIYSNRLFVFMQLIPVMLFLGAVVFQKQRERLSTDVSYARKLHAPKAAKKKIKKAKEYFAAGKTAEFYDAVFKTLQEYLGHRFNLPSAGITAEVIEELIAGERLEVKAAAKLKRCFNDCDIARYATAAIETAQMQQTLNILEEVIDCLERNKT